MQRQVHIYYLNGRGNYAFDVLNTSQYQVFTQHSFEEKLSSYPVLLCAIFSLSVL